MRLATALLALGLLYAGQAFAACTSPAGPAGRVIFNTTTKTMQYCNDTDWVNVGMSVPSASTNGCSSPAGRPGSVIYNNTLGIVQFCNGDDWVATACAETRTLGGSGCTGPVGAPGRIIFETTSKELQFCDSTSWVAMGWPCSGTPTPPPDISTLYSYDPYFGNSTSLTVVTGVNISANGGFIIFKALTAGYSLMMMDTARGFGNYLSFDNNTENYAGDFGWSAGSFNTNGFKTVVGSNPTINSGTDYGAWSFRESPRFLDIISYTGNGVAGRTLAHNLTKTPGLVIVKQRNGNHWRLWHRSQSTNVLNSTNAASVSDYTGDGSNSAEVFSENSINTATIGLGGSSSPINTNNITYVAYVFAHDPTGNISCGTYTGNGTTQTISLGWEPQFILNKRTDSTGNWYLSPTNGSFAGTEKHMPFQLTTDVEFSADAYTATTSGFTASTANFNTSGATYIYCAIRKEGV